jgi:hypothetical protein
MAEIIDTLPEVFVSHREMSTTITRMVKRGAARKLGPRRRTPKNPA